MLPADVPCRLPTADMLSAVSWVLLGLTGEDLPLLNAGDPAKCAGSCRRQQPTDSQRLCAAGAAAGTGSSWMSAGETGLHQDAVRQNCSVHALTLHCFCISRIPGCKAVSSSLSASTGTWSRQGMSRPRAGCISRTLSQDQHAMGLPALVLQNGTRQACNAVGNICAMELYSQ